MVLPASRRESGYREFRPADVQRIRFIKNAQRLGFTLQEIEDLLKLRVDGDSASADVLRQAEEKVAEITDRIRSLENMKRTLQVLVQACQTRSRTNDCPILDALDDAS